MTNFVFAGALAQDDPARLPRQFEQRAFDTLLAGRWVVLRGPRQHGKTSGLIWLRAALIDAGLDCARITLQDVPDDASYEDLLTRLRTEIAEQLGVDITGAEPPTTLEDAIAAALPDSNAGFALLLDEVSGLTRYDWSDRFFGDFRAISDRAADAEPRSVASRLLALFAGTFLTDDLISDDHPNSPFNTCVEIDTEDVTLEQARALLGRVGHEELEDLIEPAYESVGGQPFLLQYLLAAASDGSDPIERRELFEKALEELQAGRVQHVRHLFRRILEDDELRVAFQELIADDAGIPFAPVRSHALLVVVGAAEVDGVRLKARNRLYLEVGRRHPLLTPTPEVPPPTSVPPSVGSLDFMHDDRLREIARSMAEGGLAAQAEGRHRLALAGLGTALEAILMDHLDSLPGADLQAAVTAAAPTFWRYEDPTRPTSWRLVNLVKVAVETQSIGNGTGQAFDAIREWRNLVHPGKALENYMADPDLQHESAVAAGLLGMLVRELT